MSTTPRPFLFRLSSDALMLALERTRGLSPGCAEGLVLDLKDQHIDTITLLHATKLSRRGSGLWSIHGYDPTGRDVADDVHALILALHQE